MERGGPTPEPFTDHIEGHVVIVGYGRVGSHIGGVLERLGLPFLVVEQNMIHANELQRRGIKTMFGDASNSEILLHVGLEDARALVVTAPNETTVELIVTAAHAIAPQLPIIARAATADRLPHLYHLGARHVLSLIHI